MLIEAILPLASKLRQAQRKQAPGDAAAATGTATRRPPPPAATVTTTATYFPTNLFTSLQFTTFQKFSM